mgnify:CR=1 FL=1
MGWLPIPEYAMTDPFSSRMAELDALVERCRNAGAFGSGVVRDTSHRSGRDRAWWSFEVEQTEVDGADKRRRTAQIHLNSPAPGTPSVFEGQWFARIWRGENTDSFREKGSWPLPWQTPSATELEAAVAALMSAADEAIRSGSQRDG